MIPENTHGSFFNPTDVENAIVTSSWKDFAADMNSLLQLGRLEQYDCLIGVKDGITHYYFTPKLSDEEVKKIELMGCKSMKTEECFAAIPFEIQFDSNSRLEANSLSFNSMFVTEGSFMAILLTSHLFLSKKGIDLNEKMKEYSLDEDHPDFEYQFNEE